MVDKMKYSQKAAKRKRKKKEDKENKRRWCKENEKGKGQGGFQQHFILNYI